MITPNMGLMPGAFDPDEQKYEEEWEIILNTGGKYTLSKEQAWVIQEAIASGNRGIIMFKTFSISIPYIAEFYRIRRFIKGEYQLSTKTLEKPWTEEDTKNAKKRIAEIKEKLL